MVINQLSSTVMQELRYILEQMNVCALALEEISKKEQEAIHVLDSDRIMVLADRRVEAHQKLAHLETECHALLKQQGIPGDMTLEMVIDMHGGADAPDLQAIRRKLYNRVLSVDKGSQENRLRLLAAYSVTSTILQKLGLSENKSTYNRSGAK